MKALRQWHRAFQVTIAGYAHPIWPWRREAISRIRNSKSLSKFLQSRIASYTVCSSGKVIIIIVVAVVVIVIIIIIEKEILVEIKTARSLQQRHFLKQKQKQSRQM